MKVKPNKYYKWEWLKKNRVFVNGNNYYESRIYFILTDKQRVHELGIIENETFYPIKIQSYTIKWFNDNFDDSMIILKEISYEDLLVEML